MSGPNVKGRWDAQGCLCGHAGGVAYAFAFAGESAEFELAGFALMSLKWG